MKRLWPFITVADVRASSKWYQTLLGCTSPHDAAHPHREKFDQIVDSDRAVLLSLVNWGDHDAAGTPAEGPVGKGLSLYFVVDDFDAAWERARSLQANVIAEPHLVTWGFRTREFSLSDADGYHLTIGDRTQGWIATSGLL